MSDATGGQRRLLYGLIALATILFTLGITVIWLFAYGPLS